ncbi:MAG: hypothetical protein ABJB86_11510 [Bacteroidota bacterium]
MKKHIEVRKYIVTAALLLATGAWLFAADGPGVEKKKTYSKSYSLSGNEKVNINNQFGEVKIVTWGKSEVKVDVSITVKSGTDERAQAILDNINIEDSKNGEGVSFKTIIGKQEWKGDRKNNNNNNSQGMEINYEVNMPATNPLDLQNSFGKTVVPDMKGPVDISSKFGGLDAGNLADVKKVEVEFGTATIEGITNGEITIKFSQVQINKMSGAIKTFQSYSGVKLTVDNSVTSLTIKNEFTDLKLDVSSDLSANFDVYTNFSELKNKTAFNIKEEDEHDRGPKFDHQYSGKSGNASMNFKVKSNFGDVTIGHNLPFDVNDKKEHKEKRKTTSV